MTNLESNAVFKVEISTGRTPKGRPLTDFAVKCVRSSLEDIENGNAPTSKCLACGLIVSSLLIADGCPNCGGLDMTLEMNDKISKIEKR